MLYRIKLYFKSGVLSSLQSDTIFGHLCWIIAHREGEKGLNKFLEPFKRNKPPFLISDGFPHDLLPKPLSAELLCPQEVRKDVRRINWVKIDDFNKIREGKLFELLEQPKDDYYPEEILSIHNKIDRLTSTTSKEDGVYSLPEIAVSEIGIYLNIIEDDGWIDRIGNLFEELSKIGFGRRKSIGKGQFSLKRIEKFSGFVAIENENAFVTLSNFCPAESDPTCGLYKNFVKYGKLGEEFTFCGNPFKRPLLMVKTGSVFKTDGKPYEFYGRLIEGISPQKSEVVQYAYAFPVPMSFPEKIQSI